MAISNRSEAGLRIADSMCLALYLLLLCFEVIILTRFVIPLRIKSPYIISFYAFLTILLSSSCIELMTRLCSDDPAFY